MIEGTIKYYNSERRFGLIKRADGERDIRFLSDALVKAGVASAFAGQSVEFELVVDPASKKLTAGKLQFK
ncbi:MAG: cold-shock protein [Henriciella sp.]|jgi:cold shock CspA family protein|nr:cold-shock protein [Henriciella sp.]